MLTGPALGITWAMDVIRAGSGIVPSVRFLLER
jgi:hypothetical protein